MRNLTRFLEFEYEAATTQTVEFFIPDPRFEMPELLIPGRKPTGRVEIDWSNPLTKGLHSFNLCDQKYSYAGPAAVDAERVLRIKDLAGNTYDRDIYFDTNQTFGDYVGFFHDGHGCYVQNIQNSSTQRIFLDGVEGFSGTKELSLFVRFKADSALTHERFIVGTSQVNGFAVWVKSSGIIWLLNSLTNDRTPEIAIPEDGTPINVLCRYRDGEPLSMYLWDAQNGFRVSDAAGNASGSYTSYYGCNISDDDNTSSAGVYTVSMWQRHMSDAEAVSLVTNPYQFLIPA